MNKEDHTAQLSVSLILQVTVVLMAFSILGHDYPVNEYLLADLFLGSSLLPVIAALRRGDWTKKWVACMLAVLPLAYMRMKVAVELPKCQELLSNS
ncbi:hypothetical protein [Prosthecobacter fluviatilis]|uniref:Uncharacterized protein n=1 Tax=Prosthecobacter fluviatilis TaxID=445931 RepID=A0ABW0KL20_9BACT